MILGLAGKGKVADFVGRGNSNERGEGENCIISDARSMACAGLLTQMAHQHRHIRERTQRVIQMRAA